MSPEEPHRSHPGTELLSLAEVQVELRLGRGSINHLVKTGRLPSVRIGSRRLVKRSDLNTFIGSLEP